MSQFVEYWEQVKHASAHSKTFADPTGTSSILADCATSGGIGHSQGGVLSPEQIMQKSSLSAQVSHCSAQSEQYACPKSYSPSGHSHIPSVILLNGHSVQKSGLPSHSLHW